jgi:hypothetical protein
VRDPMFWKRFSTAIHDAEKGEVETVGRGSRSNSGSSGGTIGRAKHGYVKSCHWNCKAVVGSKC